MPILSSLKIQYFRNIESVELNPHPNFNFFFGKNGSGKTSILEAVYYLALGRSFRAQCFNQLIQYDQEKFSISALLSLNPDTPIPLGVERTRTGGRSIRMNFKNLQGWAPIAQSLPLCIMSAMGPRFLFNGPRIRRRFLDWLLFHVEPSFLSAWQKFQLVLKNRNAALKARCSRKELVPWDQLFIPLAYEIDNFRKKILGSLTQTLIHLLRILLPKYSFTLFYSSGWDAAQSLESLLPTRFEQERALGYSQLGPQRGDLILMADQHHVVDILSQGQQKLVHYALYLAQGQLVKEKKEISPVYLIDDLSAELDPDNCDWVLETLSERKAQTFITDIHFDASKKLPKTATQLFHVEHGSVNPVPFKIKNRSLVHVE